MVEGGYNRWHFKNNIQFELGGLAVRLDIKKLNIIIIN